MQFLAATTWSQLLRASDTRPFAPPPSRKKKLSRKKRINRLTINTHYSSKYCILLICRICYNRGNPWSVQRAGNNDKSGVPPKSCELAWSLYTRRFVPSLHPFTAKCGQRKVSTKFLNFIFQNCEKQIASCDSTGRELSFECSHHRISSTDSKVRVNLQSSIKHSGGKGLKWRKSKITVSRYWSWGDVT